MICAPRAISSPFDRYGEVRVCYRWSNCLQCRVCGKSTQRPIREAVVSENPRFGRITSPRSERPSAGLLPSSRPTSSTKMLLCVDLFSSRARRCRTLTECQTQSQARASTEAALHRTRCFQNEGPFRRKAQRCFRICAAWLALQRPKATYVNRVQ